MTERNKSCDTVETQVLIYHTGKQIMFGLFLYVREKDRHTHIFLKTTTIPIDE